MAVAKIESAVCSVYVGRIMLVAVRKDFNLYALKNIRGHFRHWGINIEDKVITDSVANIGRLYLWN